MAMARSGVIYYSKESERVYVAKGRSNSGQIIQTEKKYSRSSETFQTSDKSVKVVVKERYLHRVSETVTIKTPAGMQSARLKNSSTQAIKPPPAVKHQSSTRAIKAPAVKPVRKSSTQVVKSPVKR